MGQMIVRNIPDDVMERFKAAAKFAGKSTEQFAREIIAENAKPSRADTILRINTMRNKTKKADGQKFIDHIRHQRDTEFGRDHAEAVDDN